MVSSILEHTTIVPFVSNPIGKYYMQFLKMDIEKVRMVSNPIGKYYIRRKELIYISI